MKKSSEEPLDKVCANRALETGMGNLVRAWKEYTEQRKSQRDLTSRTLNGVATDAPAIIYRCLQIWHFDSLWIPL